MSSVTKKAPKLPNYISMLLVIVLGISLAKLMWLIISPVSKISSNTNQASPLGSVNSSSQLANINFGKVIADFHLFGDVKKDTVTKTTPTKPVAKTPVAKQLNLKLHGIVAYKNRAGYALISTSGGSQKVYGKGDSIEENVTISDLLPEKVIIDNNGSKQELLLPRNTKPGTANSSNSLLPGNNRSSRKTSKNRRSRSNSNLTKFRKEVLKNPSKLMDVATPTPATENGEFIGFRVQPGKNRQVFRQIGLRANDIILGVNGILLDDASKGAMALGELSQATSVNLTIQRGDDQITLSHSF